MSKHAKYTPKHRNHRAPSRPTKVLRNSVLYSSVAVAATGVAVSGGVLSSSADSPVNVAADFPQLGAADDVRTDEVRRDDEVSRSDRRRAADPAKAAALAGVDRTGTAVSRTEDISDEDPQEIAKALLSRPSRKSGSTDSASPRASAFRPTCSSLPLGHGCRSSFLM